MNIVIVGNFGAKNIGDEAILSGMVTMLNNNIKTSKITVLSYNPSDTKERHHVDAEYLLPYGIRSFLKFRYFSTRSVLKRADIVLLGGGALFTDEKMKAMNLWGYHAKMASRYCKRVCLFANTVGPIKTEKGRRKMREILSFLSSISVRDEESKKVIMELASDKSVIVSADPAFLLNKIIVQAKKKNIVINLRPWIFWQSRLVDHVSALCNELINKGYLVTLLPLQTYQDDDRKILQKVYDHILNKNSVQMIADELTVPKTQEIIGQAEILIGMRLHSLIFSVIQHVPFVALSYSYKISNMMNDMDMQRYDIPLQSVTTKAIITKIDQIEREKDDIVGKLMQLSKRYGEKALLNLQLLDPLSFSSEEKGRRV